MRTDWTGGLDGWVERRPYIGQRVGSEGQKGWAAPPKVPS